MSNESLEQQARAVGAVKKPGWFFLVVFALVLGTARAAHVAAPALGIRDDAFSLFGMFAGVLLSVAVLGHVPGRYRDAQTGQYEMFWSRQSRRRRVGCVIGAVVLLAVGVGIDFLAARPAADQF